jgi:hypothetical protein
MLDKISIYFPIGIETPEISAELELEEEWFEEGYEEWQPAFYSKSAEIFHYLREIAFTKFPNILDYLLPSEKHNWIIYKRERELSIIEEAIRETKRAIKAILKSNNYDELENNIKNLFIAARELDKYSKNAFITLIRKITKTFLMLDIDKITVINIISKLAPDFIKRLREKRGIDLNFTVRNVFVKRIRGYSFDKEIDKQTANEIIKSLGSTKYVKKEQDKYLIDKKFLKLYKFLVKVNNISQKIPELEEIIKRINKKQFDINELKDEKVQEIFKNYFISLKLFLKHYEGKYTPLTRYKIYIKKAELEYRAKNEISIKGVKDIVYSISPVVSSLKLKFNKIYAPYEIKELDVRFISNYLENRKDKLNKRKLMSYLLLLRPANIYNSHSPHLAYFNSIREGSSYGYITQFNVKKLDEELLAVDIVKVDKQRSLLVNKQFIANKFYPYSKSEISIGYNASDLLVFPIPEIRRILLTYPLVYNLAEQKYYLNITYEYLTNKDSFDKRLLDRMLVGLTTPKIIFIDEGKIEYNTGRETTAIQYAPFPAIDIIICYVNPNNKKLVYFPNKLFTSQNPNELYTSINIERVKEALGYHSAYYLEFDNVEDILNNLFIFNGIVNKFDYPLDTNYAISFAFSDKEAASLNSMLNVIEKAFIELKLTFDKDKVINLLTNAINHSTSINLFVFFNYKKLWEQVMFLNKRIDLEYKESYVIWRWS